MKYLLSDENRPLLLHLARSRTLLAFDFDGTLAPIIADRDAARMRPVTKERLRAICARYPCAVISGRARADVSSRLEGADVRYVVGNHGLEQGDVTFDARALMRETLAQLSAGIDPKLGVEIEDKQHSLSVHYCKARSTHEAQAMIDRALSSLRAPLRILPGKAVISLLPPRAPHKGDALLRLRSLQGAERVLYVGDDVTDEDVFSLAGGGSDWLIATRVGSGAPTAAEYFLREQGEIDRLLEALAGLRRFTEKHA